MSCGSGHNWTSGRAYVLGNLFVGDYPRSLFGGSRWLRGLGKWIFVRRVFGRRIFGSIQVWGVFRLPFFLLFLQARLAGRVSQRWLVLGKGRKRQKDEHRSCRRK